MTIDGRRWLARADTAAHHRNGNVQEIIGVGRDITEPKKAGMSAKNAARPADAGA